MRVARPLILAVRPSPFDRWILPTFKALALLAGVFFLVEASLWIRQARVDEARLVTKAATTLNETTLTMKNVREISAVMKKNSDGEAQAMLGAMTRLNTDLDKFGRTIDTANGLLLDTDAQLNAGILPEARHAIAGLSETNVLLQSDIEALKPTLDAAASTTAKIDAITHKVDLMADTVNAELPETLKNVRVTSGNVAGMTEDGKAMTAEGRAYMHKLLSPAHGTWNFIKSVGLLMAKGALLLAR